MKKILVFLSISFILISSFLAAATVASSQDLETIVTGEQYLSSRTAALDKYLKRAERIQQKLLKKLRRQEARLARKLADKDSTRYAQYKNMPLTYDSIAARSADTAVAKAQPGAKTTIIDSLKKVQNFVQQQSQRLGGASCLAGKAGLSDDYSKQLNELQQKISAQQQVKELVQQRSQALEGLMGGKEVAGLKKMQKDIYYAGEKIKAWKQLADDPDEAEEKALEYLQGTEGFSEALSTNNNAFGGMGNNATAADLERMGYQTKQSMNKMLQQKLGDQLNNVQQQMGEQVQQFQEQFKEVTGAVSEARQGINEGKQALNQARRAKDQLKQLEKPSFKKNPERGKPFWQRLETQYNFQTSRVSPDGLRPAMLELGASVAFKHTPRLSHGIGISASMGLGRDWQNIRFSYEGISLRAFSDWQWLYGFSLQAGYERAFRPQNRPYLPGATQPNDKDNALKDAFGAQQQAAYAGIMKRYRINSKWSGTFLAGYNFLWREGGMRSPFLLRFGWEK